jgi:hypothetical protein
MLPTKAIDAGYPIKRRIFPMEEKKATYQEKKIVYFNKMGRENTDHVLRLSKERFDELGLQHIIIATSSGRTAVKALDYFKGEQIVAVNSQYGYREPGKMSTKPEHLKRLQEAGVRMIYHTHLFAGIDRSINRRYGGITPTQLIGQIFKLLGEGFKVVAEIAVMAADSGGVPVDREAISIGGTTRGADTAVVLVPAHSNDFFSMQFKEIICLPRVRSLKAQSL